MVASTLQHDANRHCQVQQLELGTLDKELREANASYGHGVGADTGLTKEQAMTLEVFTAQPLTKYFST